MTEIRPHVYSAGMVSEFSSLLDKVRQLAELSHSLRSENTELRVSMATLNEENIRLAARMKEAHDRVAALINAMPESTDQEAA